MKEQIKLTGVNETGAVFCFGIKNTEDFIKICPEYKMLGDYNLTDVAKRYSPILIILISPILRSKNNRIGVFEKIW